MSSNGATKPPTIELTELESALRQLLLDTAAYIDQSSPGDAASSTVKLPEELAKAKLELRWTGGWVRDKLLGVGSKDIDIAINKMTGEQFGLKMQEYLQIPGNASKYENVGKVGLHKIEANPERSKHLETITTKVFGLEIDLVNLRKETYTNDSRNPQIEFGTPEEDALRRDATVNAMFYNLETSTIEDFTGRGLKDMQLKIIRTPLDPYQTFKDDPLRVLRLIRFASRLGYTIDEDAQAAMRNDEIKTDFKVKITRERVGIEFEKMLKGPDPCEALSLIDKLGLYNTVFDDPTQKHDFLPEVARLPLAYRFVSKLLRADRTDSASLATVLPILIRNVEDRYLAWVLSSLVPYADAPVITTGKGKPQQLAAVMAREGVKAPNRYSDIVAAAARNFGDIKNVKDQFCRQKKLSKKNAEDGDATGRDTLGMAIRQWGSSWRQQTLYALMHEIVNAPDSEDLIVSSYAEFLAHISDLGIIEAYTFKPLIDGNAIAKALSAKPGPWMKEALEVVMAWQLLHPDLTDPSLAIEALKPELKVRVAASLTTTSQSELPFRLAHHFLSSTLRPIFAQSKEQRQHAPVTATGHKNTRDLPSAKISMSGIIHTDKAKAWKKDASYVIDLLRWSITILDAKRVENNWPLLLPPVMTLLDDLDVSWKAKGVTLLKILLQRTTPELLSRTGLGDIFEKELFPLFTYLPSLTPENESIELLKATFPTLITLANIQYPSSNVQSPRSVVCVKREKFIDAIIRKGILAPYYHAGENVQIAELLLTELCPLLDAQGIYSVKHLKDLIPMLGTILSDPFGYAYPPLLVRASLALQVIMRNSKPRLAFHRGGILKGLCVCWIRLEDHGGEFADVRAELRNTAIMLREAIEGDSIAIADEINRLLAEDKRLQGLLR
ncbi:poly A polymerase C-terminal region-like protein [Pseudovirgaria hyperparasitica]|uniref:Poly A polymerase C-terminal region-like protein n=1 Tax=Pseudovirgaria hyperparasitica TaxID=470096 RepID=A0A6A6VX70_9PEZI|nr:poly A polymerase C-terminal region-like protein [Pseudovirgaria hyperparasitica]KAF2754439.1 poly A polymerase C-terminal region-like protein [Pseudovirgaria hyperparasitica]